MGMWDRVVQNASDRMSDFDESTQKYRAGERNLGEQSLMGAYHAVGGVVDVAGEPISTALSAITPDFVKEGFSDILGGIMSTEAAQSALKWAEENPRAAENLMRGGSLALELTGARVGPKVAKEALDSTARNMPNELVGFYGGGTAGQLSSVAKGLPSTVRNVAAEVFSPRARARVAEGVSPRLRSVAKEKLKANDSAGWSFFEGQADQSHLLGLGGGKKNPALQEIFGNIQSLGTGKLDDSTFKNAFSVYKPEQFKDMNIEGVPEKFLSMVKGAQKIDDAVITIRHPTALTNIGRESMGGSTASRSAKRIYKMRQLEQEYFPDKKAFSSDDEMKEFLASRFLVNDDIVRKDGKPMTKVDKARLKTTGMGQAYKHADEGTGNISAYYKYKDKLAKGEKLTKPQRAKYDKLKARVDAHKDDVSIDSDGRAFFNSSHRSAAKGLGGVADHFMVDRKGNVLHMISDENDLFGQAVPGDKRVVSITPPNKYNIFNMENAPADKVGKAKKAAHVTNVEAKYGAPAGGTSPNALRKQQAEALLSVNPALRAHHFKTPAAAAAGLAVATPAAAGEE